MFGIRRDYFVVATAGVFTLTSIIFPPPKPPLMKKKPMPMTKDADDHTKEPGGAGAWIFCYYMFLRIKAVRKREPTSGRLP